MSPITCVACGHTMQQPAAQVGSVLICANQTCGASLVDEGGLIRRATAADTTTLSDAELQTLRQARKRTR